MDRDPANLTREEQRRAIERRSEVEEKLRRDVREMVEVLKIDVPAFFVRSAEKRFVSSPDVSEKWSDDQLRRFKKDVNDAGERVARELGKALEPWDAWAWDPRQTFPEDPKGLEPNARVWAHVKKVSDDLAALLEKNGYPDSPAARETYKLPSYFVGGRFMKSLVESYWRGLQEHFELTRIIDEAGSKERREKLKARWDKA